MNLTVINKNINQQDRDADKELEHRTGHLGPHKGIGIAALYTSPDNIEGQEADQREGHIAYKERRKIVGRVAGMKVINEA